MSLQHKCRPSTSSSLTGRTRRASWPLGHDGRVGERLGIGVLRGVGGAQLVAPLLRDLRNLGIAADTDYAGRSLKGQLTQAGRSGAQTTVILRSGDALLRRAGQQDQPLAHADVLATLSK